MNYSSPVYLLAARRSPIGRFGGGLKSLSAADLAVPVAAAMLPAALRPHVDQVIAGQVLPAGGGMNLARQLGLRLELPVTTPAFTVNMVCASGLKAVALAADAVVAGQASLILAGGAEAMSRVPHYAPDLRWGRKYGDAPLVDALTADGLTDPVLGLPMGETAERIAEQLGLTRETQDEFAFQSQQKAAAARDAFRREIVALATPDGECAADEHPRADTTRARLAQLKPAFRAHGTVTAGNSSGLNDGAAFLLVGNAAAAQRHDLPLRARLVAATAIGCDPARMGLGPVGAIRQLCAETGWNLRNVDVIEINEAFAAQTLGCARELDLDLSRLNPRGGAIALGHPLGASGARILVTLLHTLEDRGLHRGIAALCVGGGMGVAVAIERPASATR